MAADIPTDILVYDGSPILSQQALELKTAEVYGPVAPAGTPAARVLYPAVASSLSSSNTLELSFNNNLSADSTARQLSPSFATSNGLISTNLSGFDYAEAVAIQDDGKIVVVGNGGDDFGVARYHANGQLDLEFGSGGKTRLNFAGVDSARDVVIQQDGKILVAGAANSEADFGLLRLNSNGLLDQTFGVRGKVTTNLLGTDYAKALAIQDDGKIVVVGNGGNDFGIARYHANGQLDLGFGSGGKTRINFAGVDSARDVVIQKDGKILVVGAANNEADFGLLRLNSNGLLD